MHLNEIMITLTGLSSSCDETGISSLIPEISTIFAVSDVDGLSEVLLRDLLTIFGISREVDGVLGVLIFLEDFYEKNSLK